MFQMSFILNSIKVSNFNTSGNKKLLHLNLDSFVFQAPKKMSQVPK